MKNILFFDVETTGVPKDYKASFSAVENWPRIVSLSWLLKKENGDEVSKADLIVKPEGYTIPEEAAKIHGISTEKALEAGTKLQTVVALFLSDLSNADIVVCHNYNFDSKVVACELFRATKNEDKSIALLEKHRVCTMEASTNFCAIPSPYKKGQFKWPKLQELHVKLFNVEFEGAHNSLSDIEATANCFFELVKRNVIKI